jgi:CheY-like chemotaxis protein
MANAKGGQSAPGLQVLVVKDNPDAAESLALVLRAYGHDVRTAADGPAALALAQAEAPDAVLLDLGLPGIDGYEVARRLRQLSLPKRPLLVAVTGYGRAQDLLRCREAGIDLHFIKPANPAELQAVLRKLQELPGGG